MLETSVRNYSVRTTFKYPARREISKVVGRPREDEERKRKNERTKGGKKGGRDTMYSKDRRRLRRGRHGRVGYNSVNGSPKLVSRGPRKMYARVRARTPEILVSRDDYPKE